MFEPVSFVMGIAVGIIIAAFAVVYFLPD